MKRILFQGDSITDAGRSRESDDWKGMGYPTFVSGKLGYEFPNEYEFLNRGVSGNRSIDLIARIKEDMINLKPDIMSVLIGVNDVWHEFGSQNGVCAEWYEKYYDILIDEVTTALPNLKIMILEPFTLKGRGNKEYWEPFRAGVEKRAECAKRIADKYGLVFVPLMKRFDEAAEKAAPSHWLIDGVHPTPAGHELIARAWIEGFEKLEK